VTSITIFDLEYTAWECSMARRWLAPGEFREVVQIGAVRICSSSFEILDAFDVLVRPRINARLSPYFENLTGISNERLLRLGVDFAQGYQRFLEFAGDGPIAAFGQDQQVLDDNIRLYGLTGMRALPEFRDLRGWFAQWGLDPRGLHSCELGPALGLAFAGHAHNALDDARAIAGAMAAMARRGAHLRPAA
jgi:inhibitor of KinA sporulation pathway (predicted exonuclease)